MKHSSSPFKWRHYAPEVILLCVRWYCRYSLSYRDLEEMMRERGLDVDHSTVFRWVQRYAPEIRYERRSQKQTSSVPPKFLLNFGGLPVGHRRAQGQAPARIADAV